MFDSRPALVVLIAIASAVHAEAAVSIEARCAISRVIGREQPSYHAHMEATGAVFLANPAQQLSVRFDQNGLLLSATGKTAVRWSVDGVGYGETIAVLPSVRPRLSANRVEYRRNGVTEWYVNGPLGLQQGFTLDARPSSRARGPLTIALRIAHTSARLDANGRGATLTAPGLPPLRYSGLLVVDAAGRDLRSWIDHRGDRVMLRVDDAQAVYPIVIDPLIQQAKLTASGPAPGDLFGSAVALSGDTVVVGARGANIGSGFDQGAAYIFVKPSAGWATMTETAKLTASDGVSPDNFGGSVGISGDTVVVGSTGDSPGAAYVFVKPPGGWVNMTETAKLTSSDRELGDRFGTAVAVSGDTIVVGAPFKAFFFPFTAEKGSVYVFVKPAGGWTSMTETATLSASDGHSFNRLGRSVAISGSTIAVGAQDAAYVFVRSGVWANMTEAARLTASDQTIFDELGKAVAVDGDIVVVGAPFDTVGSTVSQGSADLYVKPAGGWATMTETAKLTNSNATTFEFFGTSAAISGNTVVIGAPFHDVASNANEGAAYIFIKPASGWSTMTETSMLTPSDGTADDEFGISVAADGDTIVVGASFQDIGANFFQGSAYVFAPQPQADLSLTKTVSSPSVDAGAPITYTLSISNAGPAPAAGVSIADTLPPGVTFVTASGTGWSCGQSAGVVTCTTSALGLGPANPLSITVTAPLTGGAITNSATVSSSTVDPVAANNTSTVGVTVTASADLAIGKTATTPIAFGGMPVSYTLSVSNAGPTNASNVTVTDQLAAGSSFVSAVGSGWSCGVLANVLTCTRPTLAVGAAPPITLTINAPATISATTLTNIATVSSATSDPAPANNSVTATIPLLAAAAIPALGAWALALLGFVFGVIGVIVSERCGAN